MTSLLYYLTVDKILFNFSELIIQPNTYCLSASFAEIYSRSEALDWPKTDDQSEARLRD